MSDSASHHDYSPSLNHHDIPASYLGGEVLTRYPRRSGPCDLQVHVMSSAAGLDSAYLGGKSGGLTAGMMAYGCSDVEVTCVGM